MLRRVLNHAASRFDRVAHAAMFPRSRVSEESARAESLGHAERMHVLGQIRAQYDRPEHFNAPRTFFPAPEPIELHVTHVRSLRVGARGRGQAGRSWLDPGDGRTGPPVGEVVDARWPSAFTPYSGEIAARYLAYEPNRTAAARLYLHHDRPRPVVVLLHGYRCGHFAIEERVWPISWLFERGMDVAIPVLPFHATRAKVGGRPVFPSSDPRVTIEGFRQAVFDLRALVDHLYARGAPSVGALGMSLGGYTASLLATIEPRVSFAIPMIPLACIADFARAGGRLVGNEDEQRSQHAAIEAAYRVVSPLARPPVIDSDRVLVIGAAADRITPIQHARRLADHFGARLEIFHGGHLLQFGRGDAFRSVGRLLGRLGLLDASPARA